MTLRKRHEPSNRLVHPGMSAGTSTEALVWHNVHWVLILLIIRDILLVEIEKTSLYHTLIDHRIT